MLLFLESFGKPDPMVPNTSAFNSTIVARGNIN